MRYEVFISYRRRPASYLAGWLRYALAEHFGGERVFLDTSSIPPGADFAAAIARALRGCRVMLAIIDPAWLSGDDLDGRRIDRFDDPVRIELESAIELGVEILPVLLDGAQMPDPDTLPASIKSFARRNAIAIHADTAGSDITRILAATANLIGEPITSAAPVSSYAEIFPRRQNDQQANPRNARASDRRSEVQLQRLTEQLKQAYSGRAGQSLALHAALHIQLEADIVSGETFRPTDWILPNPTDIRPIAIEGGLRNALPQMFGEGDGLLLLGGPGAGKTTILFEFAAESIHNNHLPTPIYIPLAGWTGRDRTMTDWLIKQLDTLYDVPPRYGRRWIKEGRVWFLLDGLDEIDSHAARSRCIKRINQYINFERDVPVPTLVTCRPAEYRLLDIRLQLHTAAEIRPLEPAVVLDIMRNAANGHAPARTIESDPALFSLLQSPLMLSMFLSGPTDWADSLETLEHYQPDDLAKLLIDQYVEQRLALERTGNNGKNLYNPTSTTHWLTRLARNLEREERRLFFLEMSAFDWLTSAMSRRLVLLLPTLTWGAGMGLSLGVAVWLSQPTGTGGATALAGTVGVFSVLGLVAGLIDSVDFKLRAAIWILMGSALALVSAWAAGGTTILGYATSFAIYTILLGSLGEIAVRIVGGRLELVEHLTWTWAAARAGLVRRVVIGATIGVAFDVPNWLLSDQPTDQAITIGVAFGIFIGVCFALTFGLKRGIGSRSVPIRRRPNEGVRRSTTIGLAIFLGGSIFVAALFFLSGLSVSFIHGIVRAVAWGPTTGLLWGLATGLGAAMQYWAARVLLWREGSAPLRYRRWLRYAVRLRILYWSIGGGYVFMSRAVRHHFALG